MKIVFFGTPFFAATNLEFLYNNNIEIVSIVSAPDKEKGRGKKIIPTDVKIKGLELGIDVLSPRSLKDDEFLEKLKSYNADLFVVVAFKMLPKEIWNMPKIGTINLHTSLLPNYRGAAPINRVLINGEDKTGITTFNIDKKIDCGEILLQEEIKLTKNMTAAELHNILMNKGSVLLLRTINGIQENNISSVLQDDKLSTIEAPKLTKELTKIDWHKSATEIHNLVRGLSPVLSENKLLKDVSICPSAWFLFHTSEGKDIRTKLLLSKYSSKTNNKSRILETDNKSYLKINLSDGSIYIEKLQVAGKNTVTISQFLLGNKVDEKWTIS
jgi:methionyl-tRNA formyltransferase